MPCLVEASFTSSNVSGLPFCRQGRDSGWCQHREAHHCQPRPCGPDETVEKGSKLGATSLPYEAMHAACACVRLAPVGRRRQGRRPGGGGLGWGRGGGGGGGEEGEDGRGEEIEEREAEKPKVMGSEDYTQGASSASHSGSAVGLFPSPAPLHAAGHCVRFVGQNLTSDKGLLPVCVKRFAGLGKVSVELPARLGGGGFGRGAFRA